MSTLASPALPSATVVVCAYTVKRWDDVRACLDSLLAQTVAPSEVLLVVDHCPELVELARTANFPARILTNAGPQGLSGGRNTGVAAATGDVVVFLDDDAWAEPDWLEQLLTPYQDPAVVGVGGRILAAFSSPVPAWWPPEFNWVIGCSYRGLPERAAPVRNMIGASMSFRRSALSEVGGFVDGLGRVGTVPLGCEETELCIRIRQQIDGSVVLYEPASLAHHRVPAARTTWSYFRARCRAEGRSKAAVARLVGSSDALESERTYVRQALPRGVRDALRGEGQIPASARVKRAGAIVAGLTLTTAGYAAGRLTRRSRLVAETVPQASPSTVEPSPTAPPVVSLSRHD